MSSPEPDRLTILYDTECPACRAYCATVLEALPDQVSLVSARQSGPLLDQATQAGCNLDAGFVVSHSGRLHHGPAAIQLINQHLPAHHGVHRWLFGRADRAARVYPLLAAGRRWLLRTLRIAPIDNLRSRSDRS